MTTTTFHASARLRRLFIALMMLLVPAWAHEGHESGASAMGRQVAAGSSDTHASGSGDAEDPASGGDDAPLLAPGSPLYRTIKHAGKFHVVVLHFPIAFLLGAAVVQWFVVARHRGQPVVGVLLWAGTIGAVLAAALGWMYAYDSVYFGEDVELLSWHRWLGTSTAGVALLVFLFRRRLAAVPLAVALSVCAALVTVAAHYGASLVYGPDFLLKS